MDTTITQLNYRRSKASYIIVGIMLILYLMNTSCSIKQSEKMKIGFSQCCRDVWRDFMENEMNQELAFHPEVEMITKVANDDSEMQVEQIKELITLGVHVLIVAPNEAVPLIDVIRTALDRGISVILVDREIESDEYTAYVGADNYLIGTTACKYVANQFQKTGKIIEIKQAMSISPPKDRSNGFRDELKNYPNMEIVAELEAGFEVDNVDKNLPKLLDQFDDVEIIFAHTDWLIERAIQVIRREKPSRDFFFIGIDGLPGPEGGIKMVEDGILDATLLYPSGGAESIRLAVSILHNLPVNKRNILPTTVITPVNARIINLQMEKIGSLQNNVKNQIALTKNLNNIYRTQKSLNYLMILGLIFLLLLGTLLVRSLLAKQKMNTYLRKKNEEISNQKEQLFQLSQKVKKTTQARINFFTNISHEFRTPLTLILGFADDLLPSPLLNKEIKQSTYLIKENAQRLLRLVNQLMDFRKSEFSRLELSVSQNDLVAFLSNILKSFESKAKKHKIDLKFLTFEKEVIAWFDIDMMDKIMFNLISNAFKFTTYNESILVQLSLNRNQRFYEIKVQDTGRGMTPEVLEHIFKPFYQGVNTPSSGTGLGLPLTKTLVNLHHGFISSTSEEGKGSIFTISLPVGKDHFTNNQFRDSGSKSFNVLTPVLDDIDWDELENSTELFGDMHQNSILIIEDNIDIQFFLNKKLSNNYMIVKAYDGSIGLQKAFEEIPDLIICDIMLEGISGIEVTKILKDDLRTSHIPIILLTSQGTIEQQIVGFQSGADAYLTKPFNFDILNERIKNLLYNRRIVLESINKNTITEFNTASNPRINHIDQDFSNKFVTYVEEHYKDEDFQVADLCNVLQLSRSHLYRKVKALFGCSITDYIQNVRLGKAEQLIKAGELSISEIAYSVGYNSPKYFTTVFKKRYGTTPSKYVSHYKSS